MRLREFAKSITLVALIMGCGDDPPTEIRDTTPPAIIPDLAIGNGPNGHFLTWTAPGDDDTTGTVSDYEIRYIEGDLNSQWDDAISLPSPGSLVPAGQTQTAEIDSLGVGVWQFGVKAADEVPNWSDLSNITSLTIVTPPPEDTIPPAAVSDLAAEVTLQGVRLQWTAPGDDGLSGSATAYDLRYALEVITPESWAAATPVDGVGAPKTSGEPESKTVSGLQEGLEYSFALRSADEEGNMSGISNVATAQIPQTSPRQLTFNSTGCGDLGPTWSPDGSSILFTMGLRPGENCTYQLFVIPLNGGNPQQYTFSPNQAAAPDWSPDGAQFAFVARGPDGSNLGLGVMAATPGAVRTILASHSGLSVGTPQWSPDGARIAYRAFSSSGNPPTLASSLFVISSEGGTPTHLAGPFSNTSLSWSPDGTTIAFDSDQSGSANIWIMPSAGGSATRLTMGDRDFRPAWSPDGAVIAYVHFPVGVTSGQIWGIAPTGGPSFLLVNDTGVIGIVAWSPDGRSLAYQKGNPANIWVASVNAQ